MAIYNTSKTNRNKWSLIDLKGSSRKSGEWKQLRKDDPKRYNTIGKMGYDVGLLGDHSLNYTEDDVKVCVCGAADCERIDADGERTFYLPYYSNIPSTPEFIEWAIQQLRLGRQIYLVDIKIRAMYFACNESKYTQVVTQPRFKKINPHHPIKFGAINFGPARD